MFSLMRSAPHVAPRSQRDEQSGFRRFGRRLTWAVAFGSVVASAGLAEVASGGSQNVSGSTNASAKKDLGPAGDGMCDVDGVRVSYDPVYQNVAPRAGYRVANVTLHDIDAACASARLSLRLKSATALLSSAEVIVGNTGSATLALASPNPLAGDITIVDVELAGGALPIPSDCMSMTFDYVFTGTPGADNLVGTNQRDVIFGQSGADRIDALNGNDCVVAGRETTSVVLGQQSSVLTFRTGVPAAATRITAGNGDNVVRLGDGGATLVIGNGRNVIRGGAGNDSIRVGNGGNNIDGGAGSNTCFVPSQALKKNTIVRCQVVLT